MTKREMIDRIMSINQTARPEFLAEFDDQELGEYLSHLEVIPKPRLTGNSEKYDKYFARLTPAKKAPAQAAGEDYRPVARRTRGVLSAS